MSSMLGFRRKKHSKDRAADAANNAEPEARQVEAADSPEPIEPRPLEAADSDEQIEPYQAVHDEETVRGGWLIR
ncbi:MAG: hypothetical protein L0H63_13105, partial [Nitrococcus sp.]|nr:hypothetical protein [Nitrococcus sp.]